MEEVIDLLDYWEPRNSRLREVVESAIFKETEPVIFEYFFEDGILSFLSAWDPNQLMLVRADNFEELGVETSLKEAPVVIGVEGLIGVAEELDIC